MKRDIIVGVIAIAFLALLQLLHVIDLVGIITFILHPDVNTLADFTKSLLVGLVIVIIIGAFIKLIVDISHGNRSRRGH